MEVGTNIKIIIGIIVILVFGFIVGFIAYEVLTVQPSNIEAEKQIAKPDPRRITTSRFVEYTPRIVTETQQEETNTEPPEIRTAPAPERVPTAQSSDDEIKEFAAWLSFSLGREDTPEETEPEDFSTDEDAREDR